jgi:hypothetical protein
VSAGQICPLADSAACQRCLCRPSLAWLPWDQLQSLVVDCAHHQPPLGLHTTAYFVASATLAKPSFAVEGAGTQCSHSLTELPDLGNPFEQDWDLGHISCCHEHPLKFEGMLLSTCRAGSAVVVDSSSLLAAGSVGPWGPVRLAVSLGSCFQTAAVAYNTVGCFSSTCPVVLKDHTDSSFLPHRIRIALERHAAFAGVDTFLGRLGSY